MKNTELIVLIQRNQWTFFFLFLQRSRMLVTLLFIMTFNLLCPFTLLSFSPFIGILCILGAAKKGTAYNDCSYLSLPASFPLIKIIIQVINIRTRNKTYIERWIFTKQNTEIYETGNIEGSDSEAKTNPSDNSNSSGLIKLSTFNPLLPVYWWSSPWPWGGKRNEKLWLRKRWSKGSHHHITVIKIITINVCDGDYTTLYWINCFSFDGDEVMSWMMQCRWW